MTKKQRIDVTDFTDVEVSVAAAPRMIEGKCCDDGGKFPIGERIRKMKILSCTAHHFIHIGMEDKPDHIPPQREPTSLFLPTKSPNLRREQQQVEPMPRIVASELLPCKTIQTKAHSAYVQQFTTQQSKLYARNQEICAGGSEMSDSRRYAGGIESGAAATVQPIANVVESAKLSTAAAANATRSEAQKDGRAMSDPCGRRANIQVSKGLEKENVGVQGGVARAEVSVLWGVDKQHGPSFSDHMEEKMRYVAIVGQEACWHYIAGLPAKCCET
jgi:hypothetical protein